MKKTMAIVVMLPVLGFINSALILEPSSSAGTMAPAQGTPFFSINSIEVAEGTNPQAVFSVSLTYQGGSREFSASVRYSTADGTAIAAGGGGDYEPGSATVNFPPGPTPGGTVSRTISVPIIDDNVLEGDETFTVALSNPSPAFVIQGPGACIIHDNDSRPAGLFVLDELVLEGDSGPTSVVITVENTSPSNATVNYVTENFSAVAGRDYNGLPPGTLSIGARSQAVLTLSIIGDTVPEWPERFFVRLSNATGAPILDGEGICEIQDNDEPDSIMACSLDTPITHDFPAGSQQVNPIVSTINIDRDLIVDDYEVKLFVSNESLSGITKVEALLSMSNGSGSNSLFRDLEVPGGSSIGTTCSPLPDTAFTYSSAIPIQDRNGEWPYVGRWLYRGAGDLEGSNARGPWRLRVDRSPVVSNTTVASKLTLACWCLSVRGSREGLSLKPSRAVLPVLDFSTGLAQPSTIHKVRALVYANGGPVERVPVTFKVRNKGGQGDLILTEVANTDSKGLAYLSYPNWVPGEHAIEARAEVNGAIYTDIARVTWTNPCAATQSVQGTADAEAALNTIRDFRDSKLSRSTRGREYSRLYYRFSSEAVRLIMFNPMTLLRSQEMIERYLPVVRDMADGKEVMLTEGDVDEIKGFLNHFAEKGSAELKATLNGLREDLRNPEMHAELGVTIRPGARREVPARNRFQSLKQAGEITSLFGFFLLLGYCLAGRRKTKHRRSR